MIRASQKTSRTRAASPLVVAVLTALFLATSPALAQLPIVNGSFELFNATSGSGNPATYQYPQVSTWTYAGTPTTVGLLGAISDSLAVIPDTPYGGNYLLVDSRISTQNIYQSLGTIPATAQQLTLGGLIGRPQNADVADFELALYRSSGANGTPDQLLVAITTADVPGLAAKATIAVNKTYTVMPADTGKLLFVRIRLRSGTATPVKQAWLDNITVSISPDSSPPGVALLSPADGVNDAAPGSDLLATFGEPVSPGTGFIRLKRTADASTVETFNVATSSRISFSGSQVTINPTANLSDGTAYYVEIDATAIKDSSNNFFTGLSGSDAWNFATPGVGGTVASGSGKLSLEIDNGGVIRGITLGGNGGGQAFQRASLGRSIFAGTTTDSVTLSPIEQGLKCIRIIRNAQGKLANVTETFTPGLEADSIAWDLKIESADGPWTTSIQTYLQLSPVANDLRFWTAGTRTDLPQFNGYPNPLVTMPFSELHLQYGGEGNAAYVNQGCSVPIASWLNQSADRALSLVHSPFDFIQNMQLHTDATGAANFERTNLRLGGGNTIHLHMQLVAHPADWRAGMGFMTRAYPAAFDPPNPEAHTIGGGGTYADYRGETLNAARFRQMGLTMNWSARFPWPYIGMSLPPTQADTETWMSFGDGGSIVSSPASVQSMNTAADAFRQQGFNQLEYFTVTEAGTGIASTAPPRQAANDADLWKNPNDFIYYQIPNANLGIASWRGSRVVDPGDPAWQAEILRQISGISNRLPSGSGICIDRLDWLNRYNSAGDDGASWTGSPKRSLLWSWHDVMDKLIPITKARNKVVFVNSHTMRRIDVLRHADGFYAEQRGTGIHHMLAFAGARKPVVIWDSPTTHTNFQESLYLGIFPSVPFPKADHNTLPNAALEEWFLDYGPLFNAMRGKKWVLLPHIINVTSGNALANLFEVKSGYVIPVMFGGTATTATVELGPLPISQLNAIEVLHPGVETATPITPTQQGDRMVLQVPLVNGCAMVRLNAAKTTSFLPANPVPELHLAPDSWNLEWRGSEQHTYFVQQSLDLSNWDYLPVIKTGSDSLLTFGGGLDPAAPKGFFRLAVVDGSTSDPYLDDSDSDGIGNWTEIRSGSDPLHAE